MSELDPQLELSCQCWKRYSGAAAVCLGLLCVLLLAGITGLLLYQRNQLTCSNTLTKERDQLQTSGNNLTEESDQLQTNNNSLTKERDQLQTSDNTLTAERDQLQTSDNTLTAERDQLQTRYNTLTKERDQLQTSANSLTEERDQLQKEIERLKQSLVEKVCPQGWKKLGSSCYYVSTELKSWEGAVSSTGIGTVDSLILCCFFYRYWNSGEPNGGGAENCVYFYSWSSDTGEWWDYYCYYKYRWICEK
ncbi:CD209 antigen-like protein B [Salvelinus sp. IW2-2015]|uniref:CD209 antigen-like protein B n=1 Tax=Salvelinus sp. IW2-2015 TaxID=2691554 RepID=UPI0038D473D9